MPEGDAAEPTPKAKGKPGRARAAKGESTPAFAEDFPSDPALDALVRAFAAGDYARVRADAPKLAVSSEDPAVQAAARTLRERIEPDRLALVLLALTGALLLALSAWWIAHGHSPAPSPSTAPSTVLPAPTIERVR